MKTSETQCKQPEELFRSLFNSSPIGIYILQDRKFQLVNPKFQELTGYSADEVLRMDYLELVFPEDRNMVRENAVKMLKGTRSSSYQYRFVKRDRGTQWVGETVTSIQYQGRRATLGYFMDISERKQAEEELLIYQERLRALASELSLTEQRERRRIATNLHDRIGQTLAISKIKLETLRKSTSSASLTRPLGEISKLIEQTIQETRSLIFDLSPPILYLLGLEPAVEWLAERIQEQHSIPINFEDDGLPKPLDSNIRVLLFQAVRELLVNVVKHAQAHSAKVSIWREGNEIQIGVEDDGVGFDSSEIRHHVGRTSGFGLFNISERLEHLGGHLKIESRPGHGTRCTLIAPLKCGKGTTSGEAA